jgi:hypothetical protein
MRFSMFSLLVLIALVIFSWPFGLLIFANPFSGIGVWVLVYFALKPYFKPE